MSFLSKVQGAATLRAEMIIPEKAAKLSLIQAPWNKFYSKVRENGSTAGYVIAGAGRKNSKVNLIVTFFRSKAEVPQKVVLNTGFGSLPPGLDQLYKKQADYLRENRDEIDQAQKEEQAKGYKGYRAESSYEVVAVDAEEDLLIVFKCKDHGLPAELMNAIQAFAKVILASGGNLHKEFKVSALRLKGGYVYMVLSLPKEAPKEEED